jgi:Ca-activated chloride channel homolog
MRTRMATAVAIVCLVVGTVAGVLAQSAGSSGEITGTVRDGSGAVLPGVIVQVTSPSLIEKARSTTTDANGRYRIVGLPVGTYSITFTLAGFSTQKRDGIAVTSRAAHTVNATMIAGQLAESVIVTGEAPRVSKQNAREGTAADAAQNRPAPGTPGVAVQAPGSAAAIGGYYPARITPDNTESYDAVAENGIRRVETNPLSTFSIDVDTASYANTRRFLTQGTLPPADAVRVEEFVNYFHFDYPQPRGPEPFSITTELAECPWAPRHRLALIGIQGRELDDDRPKPRNLVFLLDVSGSMATPDKLPLVRDAMRMLVDVLTPHDRVAIVTYAGYSGLALPSTAGDRKDTIHRAISQLNAGGSTNGGAGIVLAYEIARQHFIRNGVNRVILATDGDFNVGVTSQNELVRLIEEQRQGGVFLSVLGVGTGNLKDSTMEKLADKGNGNYAYLDTLQEARRVLVRQASATLDTIAKDVKIQVEFNPAAVSAYRLIGYDNRMLRSRDFNDDRKDAGEIGAGHSVTALYEIVPTGVDDDHPGVDPLRYQQAPRLVPTRTAADGAELATVKVRYKAPAEDQSRLITRIVANRVLPMSANIGFASAVAEFAMLLRNSDYRGSANFTAVLARARTYRGRDDDGYRAEFVRLVDLASGVYQLRGAAGELSRK